mmetsp:Transcript_124536/g.360077  ORF Transcript_124536/g.360077 Transcript_124536/m.360077 type:complete len:209 (+) Transcript_124536:968-1594(+)
MLRTTRVVTAEVHGGFISIALLLSSSSVSPEQVSKLTLGIRAYVVLLTLSKAAANSMGPPVAAVNPIAGKSDGPACALGDAKSGEPSKPGLRRCGRPPKPPAATRAITFNNCFCTSALELRHCSTNAGSDLPACGAFCAVGGMWRPALAGSVARRFSAVFGHNPKAAPTSCSCGDILVQIAAWAWFCIARFWFEVYSVPEGAGKKGRW